MSLILTGRETGSSACRELGIKCQDALEAKDVPAMLLFEAEDAFIEFSGEDDVEFGAGDGTGRPRLILIGRPKGVRGDFPFDIAGMDYDDECLGRSLQSYAYEFTRENLIDLARKGMFEPGFRVPDIIKSSTFELPCRVDYVAIGATSPGDYPVIFAGLTPDSMSCDDVSSGYEISEYFEPVPLITKTPPEPRPRPKTLYELVAEETHEKILANVRGLTDEPEVDMKSVPEAENAGRAESAARAVPEAGLGTGFEIEGGAPDASANTNHGEPAPVVEPAVKPEPPKRDETELPDIGPAAGHGLDDPEREDEDTFYGD